MSELTKKNGTEVPRRGVIIVVTVCVLDPGTMMSSLSVIIFDVIIFAKSTSNILHGLSIE